MAIASMARHMATIADIDHIAYMTIEHMAIAHMFWL